MSDDKLIPGRGYWLKLGTQMVSATVQPPKYEINVNSLEHLAAQTLALNAIGVAEIATDREIVFEPYAVDGSSPDAAFLLLVTTTGRSVFSLRNTSTPAASSEPTAIIIPTVGSDFHGFGTLAAPPGSVKSPSDLLDRLELQQHGVVDQRIEPADDAALRRQDEVIHALPHGEIADIVVFGTK